MSLAGYVRKALVSSAFVGVFLNPVVKVDSDLEGMVNSSVSVVLDLPVAEAGGHHEEERLIILGFDMVFNGLKSGFGSLYHGNGFWEGFGKGLFAGAVVYSGKELASYTGEVPFSGAGGKLIHDLGVSMSDNVMRGENMFSHYRTDLGFVEFDFDLEEGGVELSFLPLSAGGMIYFVARGDKFEFEKSLFNLTPVFSYEDGVNDYVGVACSNVFSYNRDFHSVAGVLSHEMNHVLFFSEFRFIDDILPKKSVVSGVPVLSLFAEYFDHIKVGGLVAAGVFNIPKLIDPEAGYWYSPHEIQAYTMERKDYAIHPFYKKDGGER